MHCHFHCGLQCHERIRAKPERSGEDHLLLVRDATASICVHKTGVTLCRNVDDVCCVCSRGVTATMKCIVEQLKSCPYTVYLFELGISSEAPGSYLPLSDPALPGKTFTCLLLSDNGIQVFNPQLLFCRVQISSVSLQGTSRFPWTSSLSVRSTCCSTQTSTCSVVVSSLVYQHHFPWDSVQLLSASFQSSDKARPSWPAVLHIHHWAHKEKFVASDFCCPVQ